MSCHEVNNEALEKAYRRQRSSQSEQAWRAQFSHQRALFQQKFVDYWSHTIDACHGDSKTLWSKLWPLLQPQFDNTSCLTAEDHAQYFTLKIDHICASTAVSLPPTVNVRHVPELLSAWRPATVEEVASILKESAAKQCQLDPLPTWMVKRASDVLAPVIVRMCNASFSQTKLPSRSKMVIVRPLLKLHTGPE